MNFETIFIHFFLAITLDTSQPTGISTLGIADSVYPGVFPPSASRTTTKLHFLIHSHKSKVFRN